MDSNSSNKFVLTLDSSNFDRTIRNHHIVLVKFYDPESSFCRDFALKYERAAELLSGNDRLVLAKVDQTKEVDLAAKYIIGWFPNIKIFKDGQVEECEEYVGPRVDPEKMADFLKRIRGPFPAEIKSAQDANNLIGGNRIVTVGIFPTFSGLEYENFIKAAEKLKKKDYDFGLSLNAEHLPLGEASVSGPLVRLFKPFDERFVDTKCFDVDALLKFVQDNGLPDVTSYGDHPRIRTRFFDNEENDLAFLFINRNAKGCEAFESKYREVAKKYKRHGISFIMGDLEADQKSLQSLGLHKSQVPLMVIRKPRRGKYVKANLKPDDIESWVKEYKAGNVAEYGTSEECTNSKTVFVTADSFAEVVMDPQKNVLLELGPWCDWCKHCTKMASILDKVAVHFEKHSDVVIAKLFKNSKTSREMGLNDIGHTPAHPPILYFKKSGEKNIVAYEGVVDKISIIKFINNNRVVNQDNPSKQVPRKKKAFYKVRRLRLGPVHASCFASYQEEADALFSTTHQDTMDVV